MMMTKSRSKQLNRWKAAMALPVVMGLVVMFSTSVNLSMAQEEPKKAQTGVRQDPPPPPPPSSDNFMISDGESTVYTVVENPPEFMGGHSGLIAYMVENVKYPEEAKRKGISGTVFISFVVTSTGKVTKPVILKGVDPLLDAEALRVVKNMPDWTPGRIDDGKAVDVQFNLPVKFALDDKPKAEEKK